MEEKQAGPRVAANVKLSPGVGKEEDEKKEKRREANRRSAKKSRYREGVMLEELQRKCRELGERNRVLRSHNGALRETIEYFKVSSLHRVSSFQNNMVRNDLGTLTIRNSSCCVLDLPHYCDIAPMAMIEPFVGIPVQNNDILASHIIMSAGPFSPVGMPPIFGGPGIHPWMYGSGYHPHHPFAMASAPPMFPTSEPVYGSISNLPVGSAQTTGAGGGNEQRSPVCGKSQQQQEGGSEESNDHSSS
jgi:bZIP transcription factor